MALDEAPEITAEMREKAKQAATGKEGDYFLVIDPDVPDPTDAVPPWAIRGAFPLTATGDLIEGEYKANPNYRPGPRARGLPLPEDGNQLERALELAATQYAPMTTLLAELRTAKLLFPVAADEPRRVLVYSTDDDQPLYVAFTSNQRVPTGVATVELPFLQLAGILTATSALQLNRGSVPSVTLPGDQLLPLIGG